MRSSGNHPSTTTAVVLALSILTSTAAACAVFVHKRRRNGEEWNRRAAKPFHAHRPAISPDQQGDTNSEADGSLDDDKTQTTETDSDSNTVVLRTPKQDERDPRDCSSHSLMPVRDGCIATFKKHSSLMSATHQRINKTTATPMPMRELCTEIDSRSNKDSFHPDIDHEESAMEWKYVGKPIEEICNVSVSPSIKNDDSLSQAATDEEESVEEWKQGGKLGKTIDSPKNESYDDDLLDSNSYEKSILQSKDSGKRMAELKTASCAAANLEERHELVNVSSRAEPFEQKELDTLNTEPNLQVGKLCVSSIVPPEKLVSKLPDGESCAFSIISPEKSFDPSNLKADFAGVNGEKICGVRRMSLNPAAVDDEESVEEWTQRGKSIEEIGKTINSPSNELYDDDLLDSSSSEKSILQSKEKRTRVTELKTGLCTAVKENMEERHEPVIVFPNAEPSEQRESDAGSEEKKEMGPKSGTHNTLPDVSERELTAASIVYPEKDVDPSKLKADLAEFKTKEENVVQKTSSVEPVPQDKLVKEKLDLVDKWAGKGRRRRNESSSISGADSTTNSTASCDLLSIGSARSTRSKLFPGRHIRRHHPAEDDSASVTSCAESSLASSHATNFRPSMPKLRAVKSNHCVISNMDSVNPDPTDCQCQQSSMLACNPEHADFYLPQLRLTCSCGRKEQVEHTPTQSVRDRDSSPCDLANILRAWQVEFLTSQGIHTASELTQAYKHRPRTLAKAMRKWRKKQGLLSIRTNSCGIALHIWARTCESVVKSCREDLATTKNTEAQTTIRNLLEVKLSPRSNTGSVLDQTHARLVSP